MKTKTLSIVMVVLMMNACEKDYDDNNPIFEKNTAFEKSEALIDHYIDLLESPDTKKEERTQILCVDFEKEYRTNYMPNFLLVQKFHSEKDLINDMNRLLVSYKQQYKIECESN